MLGLAVLAVSAGSSRFGVDGRSIVEGGGLGFVALVVERAISALRDRVHLSLAA
jgi:hypothetical protein